MIIMTRLTMTMMMRGDKGVRLNMHTMVMEHVLSIADSTRDINICKQHEYD